MRNSIGVNYFIQYRINRSLPRHLISVFLLVLGMFLFLSRGAFELLLDKRTAYLVQIIGVGLMFAWLHPSFSLRSLVAMLTGLILWTCVVVSSSVVWATSSNAIAAIIYLIVMSLFIILLLLGSLGRYGKTDRDNKTFVNCIIISAVVLSVIGLLEQLQIIQGLPGATYIENGQIRPASLTGSYLHYPLVISIAAGITFECYKAVKTRIYLLSAAFLVFCVIASFSRSGALIVLCTFAAYGLYSIASQFVMSRYHVLNLMGLWCFCFCLLGLLLWNQFEKLALAAPQVERIITAASAGAAGNSGRIDAWWYGVERLLDSPVIVGGYTGIFTNISANLLGNEQAVVESGLLQQLLNLGVLGTLVFYGSMFFSVSRIKNNHILLRCTALACIIQTLFYQSVEVIPFMVLFALLPTCSNLIVPQKNPNKEHLDRQEPIISGFAMRDV